MFFTRTVGASTAFAQCVQNTMAAQYLYVDGEPNGGRPRGEQIASAWGAFRRNNNTLVFGVRPASDFPGASASTEVHGLTYLGPSRMTLYAHLANHPDWRPGGLYSTRRHWPWSFRAAELVNNYTVSLGYTHVGRSCRDSEPIAGGGVRSSCLLHPECAWTSLCGGSGTPPASMTLATAGDSAQEFVAVRNGLPDVGYYSRGEPSLPYIYGGCAYRVLEESDAVCGSASAGCPGGQLRLLRSWSGVSTAAQTTGTCLCARDPRHLVALVMPSGGSVYTVGHGALYTGTPGTSFPPTPGWNRNRVFTAIEQSAGESWSPDEPVQLRYDFLFVRPNFTLASGPPSTVSFRNADGTSRALGNGSVVRLFSGTPTAPVFAHDLGGALGPPSAWSTLMDFTLVEPTAHLIYLEGQPGRYVNVSASGALENRRTLADLAYGTLRGSGTPSPLDPAAVARQTDAAFWLIDWNGGAVNDGDRVSLQMYRPGNRGSFVSTFGSTGQAGVRGLAVADETFTINLVGGAAGGTIGHNQVVSLRSSSGTWLTAMPADPTWAYDSQVLNYATYVGAWQRFRLSFVHSFDSDRTTKW